MDTTQASPNGGGWEWGLKNPTQTKIFLLRFYNLLLGIQPLKGLLKESLQLYYYWTLCKRQSDLLLFEAFLKTYKKGKIRCWWEQKNKAKEGWNKMKWRGRKREGKEEVKNKKREE